MALRSPFPRGSGSAAASALKGSGCRQSPRDGVGLVGTDDRGCGALSDRRRSWWRRPTGARAQQRRSGLEDDCAPAVVPDQSLSAALVPAAPPACGSRTVPVPPLVLMVALQSGGKVRRGRYDDVLLTLAQ